MCEICGYVRCPAGCPNAQPVVAGLCWRCGCEIYAGDRVYNINDELWCENCIDECETEADYPDDE